MSKLIEINNSPLSLWEADSDIATIKQIYGNKLTDSEFKIFVGMGKATGLNPFLKEIWAVKYGESAAQIFIGRDGYRKSGQRSPNYDYHIVDAIYENDLFEVDNGIINHKYKMKDRGNILGAYCLIKRKDSSKPHYVVLDIKEYSTGKSLWSNESGKRSTMIKKVAESQCFRMAFQELFSGTYHEDEMGEVIEHANTKSIENGVNGLRKSLGLDEKQKEEELINSSLFEKSIESAKSVDDLEILVTDLKKLPESEKKEMRQKFYNKKKELMAADNKEESKTENKEWLEEFNGESK